MLHGSISGFTQIPSELLQVSISLEGEREVGRLGGCNRVAMRVMLLQTCALLNNYSKMP